MRVRARRLAFGLALTTCAWGEDFLTSGAGARTRGTAGVYAPWTESALDAMAVNPAGLTLLGGPVIEVSTAAMFARGTFQNAANSDGKLNANGAIPFGAFGMPIGKSRFTLGFAATPELMSAARWRYTDAPGGAGGVSYGTLDHRSEIFAMRTSAGVGVHVNSKLQLGFTVGALYNTNRLRTAYVFQNHPALAGLKTSLDLKTNGVGWNGSVGAIVSPTKKLNFGVAYKTRTTVASKGLATGNIGVQLAAIGLGAARPDFNYDAQVDNILPQSLTGHVLWHVNTRTRLMAQTDWVNWRRAFAHLPVTLTNGDNKDINGVLGTNGINDSIPLHWRNQMTARVGIEQSWRENTTLRAGYAHGNSPVPGSTLSPLTAAITRDSITAGAGYRWGRVRVDAAYVLDPKVSRTTGSSALRAGEYSNSRVRLGTHAVIISTTFKL
ncbi:MAG: outer membrane protein transport protein [Acidobacteriota bacterium]